MSPGLVLVVPCYNEEARLPQGSLEEWAGRRPDWTWVLVDDGSQDRTRSILEQLASRHANIHCHVLSRNSGKAEAVRQGMLFARHQFGSQWLGYLDADFATPAHEVERIYDLYRDQRYKLVLGCRLQRLGARITRKSLRHYVGRFAATLISVTLRLPTYDTQCGAKLIRTELVDTAFSVPFGSRWLFDVELLARCRNAMGRQRFRLAAIEEPLLEWADVEGSRLNIRDFLRIPSELWALHRRYNR
ncbi:MAG: glycosyltransferase [Vulcanimicrobiota bacterium]